MAFDKSQDHLKQTVVTSVLYAVKVVEGDLDFNSSSLQAFTTVAAEVAYVVRESNTRNSPEMMDVEDKTIHIFRTPWLVNFTAQRLPANGDKIYLDGAFWLVDDVFFTDLDDSGFHQRFRVHCTKSKRTVTP